MVEIVPTILPSIGKTLRQKEEPYDNRANIRKRREHYEKSNSNVDNAQTHKIKKPKRVPILISFLICICFVNVIMCDVSVSEINKFKRDRGDVREKTIHWLTHRYDDRLHSKNLRKGRMSTKRQADNEEKTPEAQELNKYFEIYKSKDAQNATEFPLFDMRTFIYDDTRAVGYPHDLASNPYYVKNINLNLRAERHQFREKIVKLGVLLPADPNHIFSLSKVLPILEMAVPAMTTPEGPLPGWTILVDYRDTRCSSVEGPLAAFEFYVNGSAGMF